jgi:fluoride exporter
VTILLVGIAAFVGAICRYLVDLAVQHRTEAVLPLGTLVVNLTGSVAFGFLVGLGLYHGLDSTTRTVAGVGFLGAYTTFSTFAYETVRLLEDGSLFEALVNAVLSLALGLAAAGAGIALAAAL